jgi:hypothetical protein
VLAELVDGGRRYRDFHDGLVVDGAFAFRHLAGSRHRIKGR